MCGWFGSVLLVVPFCVVSRAVWLVTIIRKDSVSENTKEENREDGC